MLDAYNDRFADKREKGKHDSSVPGGGERSMNDR